jgi:hypothetical protein
MATQILKRFTVGAYEYQLKSVACGKANCTRCPHGPYWYMAIKLRTGKVVNKYVGKSLPEGIEEP